MNVNSFKIYPDTNYGRNIVGQPSPNVQSSKFLVFFFHIHEYLFRHDLDRDHVTFKNGGCIDALEANICSDATKVLALMIISYLDRKYLQFYTCNVIGC